MKECLWGKPQGGLSLSRYGLGSFPFGAWGSGVDSTSRGIALVRCLKVLQLPRLRESYGDGD